MDGERDGKLRLGCQLRAASQPKPSGRRGDSAISERSCTGYSKLVARSSQQKGVQLECRWTPRTFDGKDYRPKYFALISVYSFHFSGRSSSAKIADTGQTGTQAPQSMHSTGSI